MVKRKYDAKVDGNQRSFIKDLQNAGATVADIHGVGRGVPDIIVGLGGLNFLVEIKNPGATRWALSQEELRFAKTWGGSIHVALSPLECLTQLRELVDGLAARLPEIQQELDRAIAKLQEEQGE